MTARPYSLRIFLPNGDPDGRFEWKTVEGASLKSLHEAEAAA